MFPLLLNQVFKAYTVFLLQKVPAFLEVKDPRAILLFLKKIEGQDYQALHGAKRIRLQFWVKSSLVGTYSIALTNSAESRCFAKDYTISAASTWQKVTLDFATDDTGTWLFNTSTGVNIMWALVIGSGRGVSPDSWQALSSRYGSTNQINFAGTAVAHTFQIAQVTLCEISAETKAVYPFQRAGRTIQQELAMCQRYCYNPYSNGDGINTADNGPLGVGMTFTTSIGRIVHFFPVSLRTLPSLTVSATTDFIFYLNNGGNGTLTGSITFNEKSFSNTELNFASASAFNAAGGLIMIRRNVVTGYILFDAEL